MAKRNTTQSGGATWPEQRRRIANKGLFYVSETERWGSVARAWPKKRGAPSSEITKTQNENFARVIQAIKDLPDDQKVACHEIAKNSARTWRDIAFMLITGTLISLDLGEVANIQELLDEITNVPGSILVRASDVWVGLAPGDAGDVLTAPGGDGEPAWVPPAAPPGAGLYSGLLTPLATSSGTGLTTWQNQGTASVADTAAGICMTIPASGSNDVLRIRKKAAPATPYTIEAFIQLGTPVKNGGINAVMLGWTDGTKSEAIRVISNSNANAEWYGSTWSNNTTWNSNIAGGYKWDLPFMQLRIQDDGTNVKAYATVDGFNYMLIMQHAKSTGYLGSSGYSNIIFGGSASGNDVLATLTRYVETSP